MKYEQYKKIANEVKMKKLEKELIEMKQVGYIEFEEKHLAYYAGFSRAFLKSENAQKLVKKYEGGVAK